MAVHYSQLIPINKHARPTREGFGLNAQLTHAVVEKSTRLQLLFDVNIPGAQSICVELCAHASLTWSPISFLVIPL